MRFAGGFVAMGAALAVGVGIASCGSSSSTAPADASTDGAAIEDSGGVVLCPAAAPADGTPCAQVPLQCEYGSVDWSDCNATATCTTLGWSVAPPPAGSICAPNNTFCPSSAAGIAHGGACDRPGLECFFRESTCWCSPDGAADAGAVWACDDPAPGCPTTRPFLGATCSEEGQVCDYGACALHNIQERCSGGHWSFVFTTCDGG